jgi:hypothetical protein
MSRAKTQWFATDQACRQQKALLRGRSSAFQGFLAEWVKQPEHYSLSHNDFQPVKFTPVRKWPQPEKRCCVQVAVYHRRIRRPERSLAKLWVSSHATRFAVPAIRAPSLKTAAARSPPRHRAVQVFSGSERLPSQGIYAGPLPAIPDPPCCSRTQQPSWDH